MYQDVRDPGERVRAICNYGCNVEVDGGVPAKRYFRSGNEMMRMANVYYSESDYESSFILYSKFISLFVEKLPKHPEYNATSAAERKQNNQKLKIAFPRAEETKRKLLALYITEEENRRADEKKRQQELAAQEFLRKQAEEQRQIQLQKHLEEEASHRQQLQEQYRLQDEEQLHRLQEQERRRREQQEADMSVAGMAVAMGGVSVNDSLPDVPPPSYGSAAAPSAPAMPDVPNRDWKPTSPTAPLIPQPDSFSSYGPPAVDRSSKPVSHFTSTGAATSNKYGLRDVIVPAEITLKFLNLALANTNRNIETLAMLCGKLAKNAFIITHLVIPNQTGTHDSCDMMDEAEIVMYQDTNDLIMLGWVHTHPQYDVFLSSVDLHIHCWYQKMLPEAVAIVCSPKFNTTGYLCLTPDHGLDYVAKCKETGFHKHADHPALWENCSHVKVDPSLTAVVKDMRK